MARPAPDHLRRPLRMLRYAIEALLVLPFIIIAWALPVTVASALGAGFGTVLYYLHPGTRRARETLQTALPERAAEHDDILRAMWRNVGRVLMEYPHLDKLWTKGRVKMMWHTDPQNYRNRPVIFVGAHLANWECVPMAAHKTGVAVLNVYRPLNNPFLEPFLRYARRVNGDTMLPKGKEAGMQIMRHVRAGGSVGLLIDQHMSDGMPVPFFGHTVLAPPTAALLAVKYGAAIIPLRTERLGGTRITVTTLPELPMPEGTEEERITALTAEIYRHYEEWIRKRPGQWLWLHRRFRAI